MPSTLKEHGDVYAKAVSGKLGDGFCCMGIFLGVLLDLNTPFFGFLLPTLVIAHSWVQN